MFDLPAAKRIRRADLYSRSTSSESSESDEELTALFHSKLEHAYGPVATDVTPKLAAKNPSENIAPLPTAPEPDDGFEFRLFASPREHVQAADIPKSEHFVPRIILDKELAVGDLKRQDGFVVPQRDEGYYFTQGLTPERREEFKLAAVSGEDLRRQLQVRYTGLMVPWRVRHLRNGKLLCTADESQEMAIEAPLAAELKRNAQCEVHSSSLVKKGKPGKKRRIILRVRKKKAEDAARRRLEETERKKRVDAEKEEAEREKRTRRNREKKVKKKMKEREKKIAAGGNSQMNPEPDSINARGETTS